MIIYDLQCDGQHRFEGWFRDAEDYESQHRSGLLSCPVCGSARVQRVPSASYVNTHSGSGELRGAMRELAGLHRRSQDLVRKLHEYVERNYEDVGTRFAEEAKRMHYGELPERNIRGLATADEVRELHEEGISAVPLPPRPVDKEKLN